MMLYKNTKVKVYSPDGDTDYFDIVAGVLQGDTLVSYLFIICLDYMLWTSIDLMKENSFTLAKERSRRYPAQTIIDTDYIMLLANTESLLHSLEWAADGVGLHVNTDKREYMGFNQRGDVSTLNGGPLTLVDNFTYLGSSVSSTENDKPLAKAWTAINRPSVISKSDLSNKIKRSFFPSSSRINIVIWVHHMDAKCMKKKLDSNYTRMMWAVLNKSWRQHPTKQQLYSHLPPIMKTIQISQTRHAGHCWRSKDKLISDVFLFLWHLVNKFVTNWW